MHLYQSQYEVLIPSGKTSQRLIMGVIESAAEGGQASRCMDCIGLIDFDLLLSQRGMIDGINYVWSG